MTNPPRFQGKPESRVVWLFVGRGPPGQGREVIGWFSNRQRTPTRRSAKAARPALKRRLSNVVYAQMVADAKRLQQTRPGGHSRTTLQSSVTDLTPDIGSSDKPLPGPATEQRRTVIPAAS